jgi:sortase (surface protein transpeptidase)
MVSSSVVLLFLQKRVTNIINKNQSIKENQLTREHEKKKKRKDQSSNKRQHLKVQTTQNGEP